jgi:hypothetical protein
VFLITIEILLQVVGYPSNGNIYLLGTYPFVKTRSIEEWQALYEKVLSDSTSYFQYDSITGWRHRPNSTSQDGLMHFNNMGIRSQKKYINIYPSKDTVRIMLLGSSVMLSAEIADTNALSFYLEKELIKAGKRVEVLNLGIGSFGNDQALLLWEHQAKQFQPDIVIQGVHLSECWLNMNIFKYCSHPPTGILYSKPRAIVKNDSLVWLNFPALRPEKLLDSIIIHYEKQPYYPYEYFKDTRRVGKRVWENFYLYQIYYQYYKINTLKNIEKNADGQILMQRLLKSLKTSVEKEKATYVMLKLASYEDLQAMQISAKVPKQPIWSNIEDSKHIVSTYDVLSKEKLSKLFVVAHASHYSALGNKLIAKQLSDYLLRNKLIVKKGMK